METVFLDAAAMTDRASVHDHLAARLGLPACYGRNLDALFDLLSTREGETRLVVRNAALLPKNLGAYALPLLAVLRDAAAENPGLTVSFEGR